MVSLPLMKRDWKDTWKLIWGVTAFLGIYTAVMIGLYDVIKGMERRFLKVLHIIFVWRWGFTWVSCQT